MQIRKALPETNRLSIILAAIMLGFALTRFFSFPAQLISFSIAGILLEFTADFQTVITLLTVILAAAGMEWLLQSHPDHNKHMIRWIYIQHMIVPVLTTLVIGVALATFTDTLTWWITFVMGGVILSAVFIAEYNVVVFDDILYPFAAIGLGSLSFVLYLLLSIALYAAGLRLYIQLPLLMIGAVMVISRSLYLRLRKWQPIWTFINSLVVSELAIGFHYLPLNAFQFGLLLVGSAYALTSIVTAIKENRRKWSLWAEPISMLCLMIVVSLIWG